MRHSSETLGPREEARRTEGEQGSQWNKGAGRAVSRSGENLSDGLIREGKAGPG